MFFSNEPAFGEPKTNSIENALSLRYQVPKIFPLLSTLYILERVAGKISIHVLLTVFRTNSIMPQNYNIIPTLCLMLQI